MNKQELIQAKEHILKCCEGHPNYSNQAALEVIDTKLKDLAILNWISKNRDKLSDFIEMQSEGMDAKRLIERNEKLNHEIKLFKKSMEGKAVSYTSPFTRLYSFIR